MKTPNEVVLEVATEMMYTSMHWVTAETICNWATRLCEAMKHKEVSNVARMRKALEFTLSHLDEDEYSPDPVIEKILSETNAALYAPPRNCDLYETEEEAYRAYRNCMANRNAKEYQYFEPWLFSEAKGEAK